MRAIHYGVGPVGAEVVRLVLERAYIDSVAAIDPARAGRDLGEVVGIDRRLGSTVAYEPESVLTGVDADVVLHTGQASLATAYPQIAQAVTAGKSVISDCAELVFPWFRHPEISRRLDRLAREAGVAVLGVGVGSGFVMDSLPLLLATACSQIKAVSVKRVFDRSPAAATLVCPVCGGRS
jgi:4-hydroxy-tetrahydrodipicolinate reductase